MKPYVTIAAIAIGLGVTFGGGRARGCDYVQAFAAPACYVAPPVQIQQSYSYSYAPAAVLQRSYSYAPAPVEFRSYSQGIRVEKASARFSQGYAPVQEVRFRSRSRSKGFSAQPVAVVPAPAIQVNVNNGRRGLLGFRR